MIQETGGGDARSLAAWEKDPVQVNVPGDWNKYKEDIGLKEPKARNEGTLEGNLKAALAYLCRKGFGKSAQPARNDRDRFFDDWKTALTRYGPPQDKGYAQRIIDRANDPSTYHKIEK